MDSNILSMDAATSMDITMQVSKKQSLSEMISQIEQTHHVFTREIIAHIKELFNSQELDSVVAFADIKRCFEELEADLIPHLIKEERILFPYIVGLDGESGQLPASCFGSVANPIRMMETEHQEVKKLLCQLRELTGNYLPHPDGNSIVSVLYGALAALDRDLVQHIHLENDVLFPQALEIEKKASS